MSSKRPAPDEFAEYYGMYVSKVPDGDVVETLRRQLVATEALLGGLPAAKADFRYEPGKWSLKEVLGHVVDTEWTFTYRAMRFARADTTPLPGIEQDDLVAGANFSERPLGSILTELGHLRRADTTLFESFGPEVLERRGTASDCVFSVRSILWIIAGHAQHHLGVIESRYL